MFPLAPIPYPGSWLGSKDAVGGALAVVRRLQPREVFLFTKSLLLMSFLALLAATRHCPGDTRGSKRYIWFFPNWHLMYNVANCALRVECGNRKHRMVMMGIYTVWNYTTKFFGNKIVSTTKDLFDSSIYKHRGWPSPSLEQLHFIDTLCFRWQGASGDELLNFDIDKMPSWHELQFTGEEL